jgi:adenosylcobinamide-GDP ribazoletransferase
MELKPRSNNFQNGIIFAISYFSSLPIRLKSFEADDSFYRGVIYGLPITGGVLAFVAIFTFLFFNLFFPSFYSAFLTSFIYLVYYGFLHLEGLADTIDGWYASLSNKDVYKIMKEPQIGAIGAIGTFCIIAIKVAVLTYLLYLEEYLLIFLSFVLSRFSLYFVLDLEIHEKSSFLISMKQVKKNLYFFDTFLLPVKWLTFFIINKISKRIGFINGDIMGFTIEILELILLHIALFIVI